MLRVCLDSCQRCVLLHVVVKTRFEEGVVDDVTWLRMMSFVPTLKMFTLLCAFNAPISSAKQVFPIFQCMKILVFLASTILELSVLPLLSLNQVYIAVTPSVHLLSGNLAASSLEESRG